MSETSFGGKYTDITRLGPARSRQRTSDHTRRLARSAYTARTHDLRMHASAARRERKACSDSCCSLKSPKRAKPPAVRGSLSPPPSLPSAGLCAYTQRSADGALYAWRAHVRRLDRAWAGLCSFASHTASGRSPKKISASCGLYRAQCQKGDRETHTTRSCANRRPVEHWSRSKYVQALRTFQNSSKLRK